MNYTVKKGDTLWGIAQTQLGASSRWKELGYQGDPNKLQIGEDLVIPQQSVSKSETEAQKVVDEVSPAELGSPSTNVDFSQAPNIRTNAGDVTAGANNLQAQFDVQLKNSYCRKLYLIIFDFTGCTFRTEVPLLSYNFLV